MKAVALNLSAPLQSWAGPSVVKTRVDTKREPSVRAIQGLIAAAYGFPRISRGAKYPDPIQGLKISCHQINGGVIVRDFQTIGSRSGEEAYLARIGSIMNNGKRPPGILSADGQGGTSIVNRTYLGEATFIVLVQGRTDIETNEVYNKLSAPVFSPYLGRKAFSPTFPFLLGVFDADKAVDQSLQKLTTIAGELRGE